MDGDEQRAAWPAVVAPLPPPPLGTGGRLRSAGRGRLRWVVLVAGLVANIGVLLVLARPARFDRSEVGVLATLVVLFAVPTLVAALFGNAVFRIVTLLELVFVLLLTVQAGLWLLPLGVAMVAATCTARPRRDWWAAAVVGAAGASAFVLVAVTVLIVPPDQPDLWACYGPFRAGGTRDTNAVFETLSIRTEKGRTHRPGVGAISVRADGVQVGVGPYVSDAELADIRRRMSAAPGVRVVRSDGCAGS